MAMGLSVTDGFDAFRAFTVAFTWSSEGQGMGRHHTRALDEVLSTFVAYCNLSYHTHLCVLSFT